MALRCNFCPTIILRDPVPTCVLPVPAVLLEVDVDAEGRAAVRGAPRRLEEESAVSCGVAVGAVHAAVAAGAGVDRPALGHVDRLQAVAGVHLVAQHRARHRRPQQRHQNQYCHPLRMLLNHTSTCLEWLSLCPEESNIYGC